MVVLGAVVLSVLNTWLLREAPVDLSAVSVGLYGAVLVIVTLIRPAGLIPARQYARGEMHHRTRPELTVRQ